MGLHVELGRLLLGLTMSSGDWARTFCSGVTDVVAEDTAPVIWLESCLSLAWADSIAAGVYVVWCLKEELKMPRRIGG